MASILGLCVLAASSTLSAAETSNPIVIGLDAAMSGDDAQGGEAIRRGALVAIEEINAEGGVLGRKFSIVVKNHRANPARGIDNIDDFAKVKDLVAVIGGVHTPVAMAELKAIHRHGIIYLGPWAAGTPIVANGYEPNFVFRVSVRDEHAGGFLIAAARDRGFKRPGLLLWRTGWGRSNEKAMNAAMQDIGMSLAGIEWFNSGERDMTRQVKALKAKGADVVMLVANSTEGITAINSIAQLPQVIRPPVISHWGITGGNFFEKAKADIAVTDLSFLQTFSFFEPPFPERAKPVYQRYCALFGPCTSESDVLSPVGVAHAYDLVHLLRAAIIKAGSVNRPEVRDALEMLGPLEGLMRNYDPPFTEARHDALDARGFRLSRFDANGVIVPANTP
ncbi:MAG: ABC transporter substrate-binding protein [Alphaproteobacteria bacterium]